MSNQQFFGDGGSPSLLGIETVTGDTGGPVPGSGVPVNLNLIGDLPHGTVVNGTPGTSTQQVTTVDATAAATVGASQKGTSSYYSVDFNVTAGFVSLANSTTGTAQTIGAVTANVISLPLGATPGTYALEGRIAGFNASTPAGTGFQVFATMRTDGATATLIGVPDIVGNGDAAVNTALADVIVSGNNAIIQVTGVAALTIDWGADLEYTFRG